MSRLARAAVVLIVVAVATVPLAADWCAISCEAIRATTIAPHAPACHHAMPSSRRIGDAVMPCGHDHHPIVLTAATNPPDASWMSIAGAAPAAASRDGVANAAVGKRASRRDGIQALPHPISVTLASSLRI